MFCGAHLECPQGLGKNLMALFQITSCWVCRCRTSELTTSTTSRPEAGGSTASERPPPRRMTWRPRLPAETRNSSFCRRNRWWATAGGPGSGCNGWRMRSWATHTGSGGSAPSPLSSTPGTTAGPRNPPANNGDSSPSRFSDRSLGFASTSLDSPVRTQKKLVFNSVPVIFSRQQQTGFLRQRWMNLFFKMKNFSHAKVTETKRQLPPFNGILIVYHREKWKSGLTLSDLSSWANTILSAIKRFASTVRVSLKFGVFNSMNRFRSLCNDFSRLWRNFFSNTAENNTFHSDLNRFLK